jgi:hypothetical protein
VTLWFGADSLLGWIKNGPQPVPLVTTGPSRPTALGQPGTVVLYGPAQFDYGTFSGGRVTAGAWLDADHCLGIEARGFLLEKRTVTGVNLSGDATRLPVLAIPFFDLSSGIETDFGANFFGERQGTIAITSSSRLWGTQLSGLWSAYSSQQLSLSLLAGFRQLDLTEAEELAAYRNSLSPLLLIPFLGVNCGPGFATIIVDHFQTRNQFYGGQLGARASFLAGRLSGQTDIRVGLGSTH